MPRPHQYTDPVPVRFKPSDLERIEQAAAAGGHTRSSFVRHAALTMARQVLGPVDHRTTEAQGQASGQA
ncbi:MAG: DUF1778 domain-containing protein [Thermodesulfobacteriota bacterium]|jgi:uncharacterized protein (DUF1778 family)